MMKTWHRLRRFAHCLTTFHRTQDRWLEVHEDGRRVSHYEELSCYDCGIVFYSDVPPTVDFPPDFD